MDEGPQLKGWLLGLITGASGVGALVIVGLLASRNFGATSLDPAPTPQGYPSMAVSQGNAFPVRSSTALQACADRLQLGAEQRALAHPSNFGEREPRDWRGSTIASTPELVVIHETVLDQAQTIALFQHNHPADDDQVSYHMLINQAGQRVRIVPDRNRAYGAGHSAFGDFTIRAKQQSPGSVNNVALHVSLETPVDGRSDDGSTSHSGYSQAQYNALAGQVLLWQATYGIPMGRVTTHAAVDRSHSRYDPRSFRWDAFDIAYDKVRQACGF